MKMLNHKGTVTLQTERLLLRPFSTADAQAMYDNWATDPEVTKFLTWERHRSVQDTLAFLSSLDYNKPDVYQWAIVYQGVVIGSISITEIDENARIGAFGYCIGRSFWRQGIMSEAVQALLPFLFDEVGFHRVEIDHAEKIQLPAQLPKKAALLTRAKAAQNFTVTGNTWISATGQCCRRTEWFANIEKADWFWFVCEKESCGRSSIKIRTSFGYT